MPEPKTCKFCGADLKSPYKKCQICGGDQTFWHYVKLLNLNNIVSIGVLIFAFLQLMSAKETLQSAENASHQAENAMIQIENTRWGIDSTSNELQEITLLNLELSFLLANQSFLAISISEPANKRVDEIMDELSSKLKLSEDWWEYRKLNYYPNRDWDK